MRGNIFNKQFFSFPIYHPGFIPIRQFLSLIGIVQMKRIRVRIILENQTTLYVFCKMLQKTSRPTINTTNNNSLVLQLPGGYFKIFLCPHEFPHLLYVLFRLYFHIPIQPRRFSPVHII